MLCGYSPFLQDKAAQGAGAVERKKQRAGRQQATWSGGDKQREQTAKSFFALVVCAVGVLLGLVGLVTPFFTGPATTADVSIQAVGILLGVVGYYFGARRFAIAAVALCIVAIFFGLATSQDLIPGIQGEDRSLPSVEPGAQRPDS